MHRSDPPLTGVYKAEMSAILMYGKKEIYVEYDRKTNEWVVVSEEHSGVPSYSVPKEWSMKVLRPEQRKPLDILKERKLRGYFDGDTIKALIKQHELEAAGQRRLFDG